MAELELSTSVNTPDKDIVLLDSSSLAVTLSNGAATMGGSSTGATITVTVAVLDSSVPSLAL